MLLDHFIYQLVLEGLYLGRKLFVDRLLNNLLQFSRSKEVLLVFLCCFSHILL